MRDLNPNMLKESSSAFVAWTFALLCSVVVVAAPGVSTVALVSHLSQEGGRGGPGSGSLLWILRSLFLHSAGGGWRGTVEGNRWMAPVVSGGSAPGCGLAPMIKWMCSPASCGARHVYCHCYKLWASGCVLFTLTCCSRHGICIRLILHAGLNQQLNAARCCLLLPGDIPLLWTSPAFTFISLKIIPEFSLKGMELKGQPQLSDYFYFIYLFKCKVDGT